MNKYPTIRKQQIKNIENLGYKFIDLNLYDSESQILTILNKHKEITKIRFLNSNFHIDMNRLFKGENV